MEENVNQIKSGTIVNGKCRKLNICGKRYTSNPLYMVAKMVNI